MYLTREIFKGEKSFFQYAFYDKYLHREVLRMTKEVKIATYYYSKKDAQKICKKYSNKKLKVVRFCPICKCDYDDHPAISLIDNETEICPSCNMKQVIESYNKNTQ